jgi:hypothetical protein
MALWHFGQVGGAWFFGMSLTLDQARVLSNSLSPMTAKTRAVIQKAYRLKFRFVCPISDTGFLNFS